MSRVGKKPIQIPDKTEISYQNRKLTVKGGKGSLSRTIHPAVDLKIDSGIMNITVIQDDRSGNAFQGLTRSLVANMIKGVNTGFERTLEINGIGYRAEIKGHSIVFTLGYSHPINFDLPEGISANIERNTLIKLSGIDKELLGHTAAAIRQLRPPEPYKGKGIKYVEEVIHKKAGKTGTK